MTKRTPKQAIEPPEFCQLWELWRPHARKSDGRGKARPTYLAWIEAGADPADIYDGARWHLFSMKDAERPYIQLLSVYLNTERWRDECEEWRRYQARLSERQENVVPIRRAELPANHFSKVWAQRGNSGE